MTIQQTGLLAIGSVLSAILVSIFWMVVGWRAMRAHERIADALFRSATRRAQLHRAQLHQERDQDEKSFRDFLQADPLAKHCDAAEQMRRFHSWRENQKAD